jgi:hypothetical protein
MPLFLIQSCSCITLGTEATSEPLRIDEKLASLVNMSRSTFHHHSERSTWLMLTDRLDGTNAAYETPSPIQARYSRSFRRLTVADNTSLRTSGQDGVRKPPY